MTTPNSFDDLRPKFLDLVENSYASESSSRRLGIFVRSGRGTGRLNLGEYLVLTDGHGDFWTVGARNNGLKITGNLLLTHRNAELEKLLEQANTFAVLYEPSNAADIRN
jgi:hypothetical protein